MQNIPFISTSAGITLEKLLIKTPKLRAKIQTSISEHNLAMQRCSQLTPIWLARVVLNLVNSEYKRRLQELQDRIDKDSDYEGNSAEDVDNIVSCTLNILVASYRNTLKSISFS